MPCPNPSQMKKQNQHLLIQSISREAMACEFEVLLNEHEYSHGVDAAVEALDVVDHIDRLLSVFRPQSQLSKINRYAFERPVLVDAMTLELVKLALDAFTLTDGAFDLTAGSLSEVWGFSRRQGAMPSQEQIQQALDCVGSKYICVKEQDSTVALTRPGVRLNSGGIGKGFALDHAARKLVDHQVDHFMIHGGQSSIVARGQRNANWCQSGCWTVALKHPWRSNEVLETLSLCDEALATSGSGKQFFHFGGKRYSHLIDPRTGWPAQQMMSTTVICSSGALADALATGLFILGPDAAIEFCEAHSEIRAILVYCDPKTGQQRLERRNF